MLSKHTHRRSSLGHSRHKFSSRSNSSKASISTSKSFVYQPEASDLAIWENVQPRTSDKRGVVLIVGNPQESESLTRFLTKGKNFVIKTSHNNNDILAKPGAIESLVMVITPNELQAALETASILKIRPAESMESEFEGEGVRIPTNLCIFVTRSINAITYKISSSIMNVMITLCGQISPTQAGSDRYPLRITTDSTYCNIETWKWERRDSCLDRTLSHGEGMYFDTTSLTIHGVPSVPEMPSSEMRARMDHIQSQFPSLARSEGNMASGSSASQAEGPSTYTDKQIRWFNKWLDLIAAVAGVAGGALGGVAGFSFCWFNAGGFFIKGPWGLYLSGAYFTVGGVATAAAAGISGGLLAGAAAYTAIYYIPWSQILNFVRSVLIDMWQRIEELAYAIWEKLKSLASNVADFLAQGFTQRSYRNFNYMEI